MAPSTDPATWVHESSIIKEDELREMAEFLGKGFRIHHRDAVGGISLSRNPDPQKYMVMYYHSVGNRFRLPLHGLVRDMCQTFEFPPGQLTANAHKYVASYILRCCALDKTPTLDEFFVLFSIGGDFPFYSVFPHPQFPVFEKVESKIDRWARRYFVIEFPAHSPLDLSGIVCRSSLSRNPFATAPEAEGAYNALREEGGLISHHSLQDARLHKKADFYYPLGPDPFPFEGVSSPRRSKASPVVESHPAENSSRNQAQGDATALAICKPFAALDVVPISAIPGLRKPTPSQKRPREGVTDDDFLPKKSRGDGTPASPRPLTASSGTKDATPVAASGGLELPNPDSLDHDADKSPDQAPLQRPTASHSTIQVNLEKMTGLVQGPTISQARPDLLALNALYSIEQAQQSLLTLTKEYLGGAWGNYRAMVVLKDKELAARALQQKVDSLEQQVQALQEENSRLKADASAELMDERSRVKSLQEQIATYQGSTHDLET
ncbi:unnamed protein product [Cuscuta campestris]|uniref:Uncharacterized protein n=1 Tax=Cuscuta campestris TaxID=132261 RepID=A0A484LU81_9ASTE|nr:unnamed protein product [Cuscuta campestris]